MEYFVRPLVVSNIVRIENLHLAYWQFVNIGFWLPLTSEFNEYLFTTKSYRRVRYNYETWRLLHCFLF